VSRRGSRHTWHRTLSGLHRAQLSFAFATSRARAHPPPPPPTHTHTLTHHTHTHTHTTCAVPPLSAGWASSKGCSWAACWGVAASPACTRVGTAACCSLVPVHPYRVQDPIVPCLRLPPWLPLLGRSARCACVRGCRAGRWKGTMVAVKVVDTHLAQDQRIDLRSEPLLRCSRGNRLWSLCMAGFLYFGRRGAHPRRPTSLPGLRRC
jgi:hypothetical protein